jgi:hypothetical protein
MKTERRHQLETNELADSLAHWVEAVKPYSRMISGLLIALVVLAFAYAFVGRHSAAKARQGWDEYFQASNQQFSREKLEDVADKFPGTPAAWWSRTVVGDMNLNDGVNLLFNDKASARDKLHAAVSDYESVVKEATETAVQQRATYGLARAHEALGELDDARKFYLQLCSKWPDSALEKPARQRANDLERQGTKEFYDWFEKQSPEKSLLSEPGKPGERPKLDLNIPEVDSSKPLFPDSGKLGKDPADSSTPPADTPSTDDAPGDKASPESTPSDDAPGDDKAGTTPEK